MFRCFLHQAIQGLLCSHTDLIYSKVHKKYIEVYNPNKQSTWQYTSQKQSRCEYTSKKQSTCEIKRNNVLKTMCLVQEITVLPPDIDKLPHTEVERMFSVYMGVRKLIL